MAGKNNEQEEPMRNKIDLFIIAVIILGLVFALTVIALFGKAFTEEPSDIIDDPRFDVMVTQKGESDSYVKQYIVVADRETDVEYLIVVGKSGGLGVTTMRDTGGTVLLRE